MGVDLNSNWRRRHLLVFPIKGRAPLLCSIPLLLHAESEIAPLCREIGLIIWRGNWTSDWCAVLTQSNLISGSIESTPPSSRDQFQSGYRGETLRVRLCISLLGMLDWFCISFWKWWWKSFDAVEGEKQGSRGSFLCDGFC